MGRIEYNNVKIAAYRRMACSCVMYTPYNMGIVSDETIRPHWSLNQMGATIHWTSHTVIALAAIYISKTIYNHSLSQQNHHGDQSNKGKSREGWLSVLWQSTITAKPEALLGLTLSFQWSLDSNGTGYLNETISIVLAEVNLKRINLHTFF